MNNQKSIKIVVYTAILASLAFVLNFIEIPYFIAPWLKIEFSEVITLIATSLSIYIGFFVAIIKAILMTISGTTTGYIGEITLLTSSFVIIIVYYVCNNILKLRKLITFVILAIIFTFVMTALNYFVITPFFFNMSFSDLVSSTQTLNLFGTDYNFSYLMYIIVVYVPFNLIKIILDIVLFHFIFEKLQKALGNKLKI